MAQREALLDDLKSELLKLMPLSEHRESSIPSVSFTRANAPQQCNACLYQPMLVLVLQGMKQAHIGATTIQYKAGQTMIVALDMPGVYEIRDASEKRPFLAIAIELDRRILTELLTASPELAHNITSPNVSPVMADDASEEVLDAFLRLIRLEETPSRIGVFAPLILKELHFLALNSLQGECLRHFCSGNTPAPRIANSVEWLRTHFSSTVSVNELAQHVGMSASAFHKHFKEFTTLSPLQFQKRLRLQEAERLMLIEGKNVDYAAYAVGYKSSSQFSREYKRTFGSAPHRDISRKRAALSF